MPPKAPPRPSGDSDSDPTDHHVVCPVCKTSSYIHKDLELLINPECYHQMCVTCVDRIFRDGPAQCPHAGCRRTLRRAKFRAPYFGDLSVEREVDARRRVADVFNKVQDDFETIADHNEYLERVETLAMDLARGSDEARSRAERELAEWEAVHRAEIERNRAAGREADRARQRRAAAEAEAHRQRRLEALREDEEVRRQEARLKEEMLDGLAGAETGSGAARAVVGRIMLKRRGQQQQQRRRSAAAEAEAEDELGDRKTSHLSIRGLRTRRGRRGGPDHLAAMAGPYDPFAGLDLSLTRHTPAEPSVYHSQWVDDVRTRPEMRTGGYSADEYLSRALFEAFAGLGVFVGEEKEGVP